MGGDGDGDGDGDLLLPLLHEEEEDNKEKSNTESSTKDRGEEVDIDDDDQNLKNHHQHRRHYLQSIEATLTSTQIRSQGLSFQLWPAASTLLSLLDRAPSSLLLPPSTATPLNILELGSGTGLVGIAAAAVLGAHVTLTDLPHVLPNLQFNADANADAVAARRGSISVRQLIWGDEGDSSSSASVASFDVVMASDVVYYEHLIDPLLQTLSWFVKGEVVFIMAHLRRWKKRDSLFFRKARKLFDVALLHTDPPLPGSRIGVAVYRFTAKKNAAAS